MGSKMTTFDETYSQLKATDPIRKYQIMFQDEYNNLFEIGYYDTIDDTMVADINSSLSVYNVTITIEDLLGAEKQSPFGGGLDLVLYEDGDFENGTAIFLRGFVHQ